MGPLALFGPGTGGQDAAGGPTGGEAGEAVTTMFLDRRDAGRLLARRLAAAALDDPVVVALPRGGVPIAAEVARALAAPLDVLVVRKVGCPWQPELGVGAVAEGGIRLINRELVDELRLDPGDVDRIAAREDAEVARRVLRFRAARPQVPVGGRTAILIDDGVATGFTARAAIDVLRHQGAAWVVLATPVATREATAELAEVADEAIVLAQPEPFYAIGRQYADFTQVSDDEVVEELRRAAATEAGGREADCLPTLTISASIPLTRAGQAGIRPPTRYSAGDLVVPEGATGVVAFAHGSGSSRHSPRNRMVAGLLNEAGLATLLFDLLTPAEGGNRDRVFDIELLAERLVQATAWLRERDAVGDLPLGYFGASTGGAAALCAAAELSNEVRAVVSRGGRPDLAGMALVDVTAPTLLIVGSRDTTVRELNREAMKLMRCERRLELVPGANHLFEEPGTLEQAGELAARWFLHHLGTAPATGQPAEPTERPAPPPRRP
jgi:putative phosphoribosyl transferase